MTKLVKLESILHDNIIRTYSDKKSDGTSVMQTSEKLMGDSTAHTFDYYYDQCTGGENDEPVKK